MKLMTMNNDRVNYLHKAYLNDTATSKELLELESLMVDPQYADILDEAFYNSYFTAPQIHLTPHAAEKKEEIFNRIVAQPVRSTQRPLWQKIAIAASVFLAVSIGAVFYNYHSKTSNTLDLRYTNDIGPGKTGATLTLANGEKISLTAANNGKIANEAGVSITKTKDGNVVYSASSLRNEAKSSYNTLSTAKGQTYMLTLPDKSKVWLNAASSLTYTAALMEAGVRRVKLSGEAYFEVAKDKVHPFIVESGNQKVEVLGTHFNVNAYQDEKVYRTTLLEGSVKVSEHGETKILVPGHQALNAGGNIKLSEVDTELAVAWKSNNFIFDRLDIREIMRNIERWYNVEVIYKEEIPSGTFWGSVSRFDNISKVLVPLEATGNVHFKIEGRKIYVFR